MSFPDASDKFWGSYIAQVPTVELEGSVAIADMAHEPLGFLHGSFRGWQEQWATVDKEGFAIVSTFRRLPYLLRGGVAIHCDHRDLAYVFGANGTPTSQAVAQRLQGWRVFLGQFPYTIVHLPGDENCWADLLPRCVTRPGGPVCVHASVKYAEVLLGATSFRRKRLCAACRRRCGGRTHTRYGVGGGFAGFRRAIPGGAPWLPRDLGAGRGRLSEEATAGVCSTGGGQTPRDRCNQGSG